jgi:hypothetical protein
MRLSLASLPALIFFGALVFGPTACVDKDVKVEGKRPTADPKVAFTLDPEDDDPKCAYCAEAIDTSRRAPTVCRQRRAPGTPTSTELLADFVDCGCRDKCVDACRIYCSGGTREPSCLPCLLNTCSDKLAACQNDKRPQ